MTKKMNAKQVAAFDEILEAAVNKVGLKTTLEWADDPRKVELLKTLAMMNARDGISIK